MFPASVYTNYFDKLLQRSSPGLRVHPTVLGFHKCKLETMFFVPITAVEFIICDESLELIDTFSRFLLFGGFSILTLYGLNGVCSNLHHSLIFRNQFVYFPDVEEVLSARRETCPIDHTFNIITTVNILVYCAWQMPEWRRFMVRHFLLSIEPESRNFANLVLSTFSHVRFFHLIVNMLGLHGTLEIWKMGNHRNCTFLNSCHGAEFVCFYLSSGIVSSLFGCAIKMLFDIKMPSLGGSGVVCSLVAYEFCKIPFVQFPIRWPNGRNLNSMDVLNILFVCDFLGFLQMSLARVYDLEYYIGVDYAVHIGGYLYGMWYATEGDMMLRQWGSYTARCARRTHEFIKWLCSS